MPLDPSFGDCGQLRVPPGETAAHAIPLADGKIMVVDQGEDGFRLRRYLSDGTPDLGFSSSWLANYFGGHGIAVDTRGRILWQGHRAGGYISFARFSPDGELDKSFGESGIATVDVPDGARWFLEPDDRVFVYGCTYGGEAWFRRLDAAGGPDLTFAGGDELVRPGCVLSVVRLSDGNYIGLGPSDVSAAPYMLGITSAGALDESFGNGGVRAYDGDVRFEHDAAPLASGGFIATGVSTQPVAYRAALGRFLPAAQADSTFGAQGWVLGKEGGWDHIIPLRGGRVLALGHESLSGTPQTYFVSLFASDGSPDRTFGVEGTHIVPDYSFNVAVYDECRLLIGLNRFAP